MKTNGSTERRLRALLAALLVTASAANLLAVDRPGLGPRGNLSSIEFEPGGVTLLVGRNARRQLLVTGVYSSGQRHDLTHEVAYTVDKSNLLTVSAEGLVTPLGDGEAVVTARSSDGRTAMLSLKVEKCGEDLPVNFVNEVVPVFTRLGCNAGGCHGKSDGQNGFKLSLLGFYPNEDYEFLVHESRGRRIFPADPEFSLLLTKPANQLPHGGGRRMTVGSYEWELLARWIRQGMPYGSESDPVIERIQVIPPVREMNFDGRQQLSVVGHYSDGSTRDVTRLASFESNQIELAAADNSGRITVAKTPGDAAIMVRFQGQVAVFRAVIPQGLPVASAPPERNFIDQLVMKRLRQLGIPPSRLSDDAMFLRRVTLDITGSLPTYEEARAFLDDKDPQKRDRLVDRLVDSPGYADYFANKWAAVLRNKRRNGNDNVYTYRFHSWIRNALDRNLPYDQFVRSVLTATGDAESHPPVAWYKEVTTSSLQMEDTSQLFLGMRLACAKCHHHPFERWSQQDYYGFEAFFTQVGLKNSRFNPNQNLPDMVFVRDAAPAATNPRTGKPVPPTPLGGSPLTVPNWEDARQHLVDWMVAPDNPFFARALVNRYWKHFLGQGIVTPEDDLRVTNPPSNPELLDALTRHFLERRFDMKDLVRTICKSSTYQLSSEPTEENRLDRQNFSSFYPRRLTAEVLYDAINSLLSTPATFGGVPQGTTAVQLPDNGFNNYFLTVFGKPEASSACECERNPEANLAQSLHLLNSQEVQGRLQNGNGLAAQFVRAEKRPVDEMIDELYLRAFARRPAAAEMEVLWAILNAKEFQFVW
jgi:hypothetical protein